MGFTQEDLQKGHFIKAVGRLKPGASRGQAQAEMDLMMPRLHLQTWRANVFPLEKYYVGGVETALFVLLGSAGFVLLIACVNLANLLLARGSARQKEITVRSALGAVPWRIARQLLTESLVLSLAGGVFGLLLGFGGIAAVKRLALESIPRLDQVNVAYSVLVFAFSLSVLTGVFFGMLPALRLSRGTFYDSLHSGERTAGARTYTRMRSALVATEIALTFVLLTGASLLLQSFWRLLVSWPGFSPESTLTMSINLPKAKYSKPFERQEFVDRLLQGVQVLPGVREAAVSTPLPLSGIIDVGIYIDPKDMPAQTGTTANYYAVTPLYFQLMRIPLIRGRLFSGRDSTSGQP